MFRSKIDRGTVDEGYRKTTFNDRPLKVKSKGFKKKKKGSNNKKRKIADDE